MAWSLQFLGYLRTLSLKFQKAASKLEGFLSQFNWDSQQDRARKTTILVLAFWNFKFKVLKYPRNSRLHDALILNLVKPLTYILLLIFFHSSSFFSYVNYAVHVIRKAWSERFFLNPCDIRINLLPLNTHWVEFFSVVVFHFHTSSIWWDFLIFFS